jgi:hypothetical protein
MACRCGLCTLSFLFLRMWEFVYLSYNKVFIKDSVAVLLDSDFGILPFGLSTLSIFNIIINPQYFRDTASLKTRMVK